jgi:hypothetical protein
MTNEEVFYVPSSSQQGLTVPCKDEKKSFFAAEKQVRIGSGVGGKIKHVRDTIHNVEGNSGSAEHHLRPAARALFEHGQDRPRSHGHCRRCVEVAGYMDAHAVHGGRFTVIRFVFSSEDNSKTICLKAVT